MPRCTTLALSQLQWAFHEGEKKSNITHRSFRSCAFPARTGKSMFPQLAEFSLFLSPPSPHTHMLGCVSKASQLGDTELTSCGGGPPVNEHHRLLLVSCARVSLCTRAPSYNSALTSVGMAYTWCGGWVHTCLLGFSLREVGFRVGFFCRAICFLGECF